MQVQHKVRRKVHLHGRLRAEFGDSFTMAVSSPAEAIRLLEANFPGRFCELLKEGSWHVVVGDPGNDNHYYAEDRVSFESARGDIHFIPALYGSGSNSKGLISAIVGVALVALAFVTVGTSLFVGAGIAGAGAGFAGLGVSTGFLGATWGSVALFGASLAFSGIASLLTPTPKQQKSPDRIDNAFFNGGYNSTAEGGCVPVIYGRVKSASSVQIQLSTRMEKLDPTATSVKTNPIYDGPEAA
jgi:predicted phage tail protein